MKPLLAVTLGDPAGIGPEIVAKAFTDRRVHESSRLLVVGDSGVMRMGMEVARVSLGINPVAEPGEGRYEPGAIDLLDLGNVDTASLVMGKPQADAGRASVEYIVAAANLALRGQVDGIVTAPINKEAISLAGAGFPGHTELLADLAGVKEPTMMLAAGPLRVLHVTTHVPLSEVPRLVKRGLVLRKIIAADEAARSLGEPRPKVAVAGLNPHSGEGGLFGREEVEEIAPAVADARGMGIDAEGPVPPDTVFSKAAAGLYSVVVAMYHDQGHIPVKLLGFRFSGSGLEEAGGVNVTLGLPFIRTSVDHGTAYGKAGRREGTANPQSLVEAILLAAKMAESRRREREVPKDG